MPKSGIKGLLWRDNRSSGSWLVVLNVPKELQPRIVSKKGTPTKRLEQPIGTDSLALARKRFPRIMSGLQQQLEDASGLFHETPEAQHRLSIPDLFNARSTVGRFGWSVVRVGLTFKEVNDDGNRRHKEDPEALIVWQCK